MCKLELNGIIYSRELSLGSIHTVYWYGYDGFSTYRVYSVTTRNRLNKLYERQEKLKRILIDGN